MRGLLLALLVLAPVVASAQPSRLTAGQVLANVEATYQKPAQLAATFEQTVAYSATGVTKKSRGTLRVAKPDKMRWDYVDAKQKPDRHFIFDGTTLWIVEHANLQVLQHTTKHSPLPGAIAFFLGAGKLAKEFHVAFPARKHLVPGATVLELTPKQTTAAYRTVRLVIDPRTWQVTRTTVVDSSGNTNTFAFTKADTKTPIKASLFAFHPRSVPTYKVVQVNATAPAPPPPSPPPSRRRAP